MNKHQYDQVEVITNAGMMVAEVNERFYIITSFQAGFRANTGGTEFHTIIGVEVTDFFAMQKILSPDTIPYLQALQQLIEKKNSMTVRFSLVAQYFIYSK